MSWARDILGAAGWSTRDMDAYTETELEVFAEEEIADARFE